MSEADSRTIVADTSQYVMMLRIARDELAYACYHPAEDGSWVSNRFALSASAPFLQEIERIVYAHEELLQPFKKSYVLLPTLHYVVVPSEVAAIADSSVFYGALYEDDDCTVVENSLSHVGAQLYFGTESKVASFLYRTFDRPVLLHPLAPLSEYFYRKSRMGNQSKVYVHLYRGKMDVVCFGHGGLLLAGTYEYRHVNDAAYRILNVWQQLKLDQLTDEVHLAGDMAVRRDLAALLRNYIRTVVPVIFPSHCHALGSDAIQESFDFTALSLCEL